MGAGGKHAGADYQRTCFPAGTGADSKPPAGTQKRYDTDFCGTDKVCGLRLVAGLRREQAEQQAYGYYHCSKNGQGTRQCSMHYIRYDVLYAYVLSRLQYWSGLVQHDEEQLLKQLLNATDKGQAAARKKHGRRVEQSGEAESRSRYPVCPDV